MTNGRSTDESDGITYHSLNVNGFSLEGFSVDESVLDAACKKLRASPRQSHGNAALDMTPASRDFSDREIASERQDARNKSYSPSDLRNVPQTELRVGSERPSRLQRSGRRAGESLHKHLQQAHGISPFGRFEFSPRKGVAEATGGIRERLSELRRHVSDLADRCTTLEAASTQCSQVKLSEENVLVAVHSRMMKELASLQESSMHVPATSSTDLPAVDSDNNDSIDALKDYIKSLTAGTVSTASTPAHSRAPTPSPVKFDTGYHSSLSTPISSTIDSAYAMPQSVMSSELRYHRHPEQQSPPQQLQQHNTQRAIELDPPSWFKPPPGSLDDFSLGPPPMVSSAAPISPSAVDFNFHRSTSHPAASMSSWPAQGGFYGGHSGANYGNANSFNEGDLQCGASNFGRAGSHGVMNSTRPDSSWESPWNGPSESHWHGSGSADINAWQSNSRVPMHPGVAAMQWSAPGVAPYVPGQMFEQSAR